MWCTRWFLPLILLPIPTAPPYFLLVFLFSLTLHAKPCVYCIVLLTSLFVSSCYWQPFPIDTHLATPWSDSIVTFSDALRAALPPTYDKPLPHLMRAMDRCWCDASGDFFEPFNTTRWEEQSVKMLRLQLQKEQLREERQRAEIALKEQELLDGTCSKDAPHETPSNPPVPRSKPRTENAWFTRLRTILTRPSITWASNSPPPPPSTPPRDPTKNGSIVKVEKVKRELDLNPYGIGIVVDFGLDR